MAVDIDKLLLGGRLAGALVVGVGCWLVLAHRIRQLAKSRQPAMKALCVGVGALGLSMTLQIAAAAIDIRTGLPNLGRMLSNSTCLVAACMARVFWLFVLYGHATARSLARRHYRVLGVVLAVIAVLFFATPEDPASSIGDVRHELAVYSSPYVYVFLTYLTTILVMTTATAYRYLRRARGKLVRASLGLTLAGSVLGIGYAGCKLIYLLGHDLNLSVPANEALVARPLYVATSATWLAAVVIPAIGVAALGTKRWLGLYLSYQRLFPLWRSLHGASASLVIAPRRSRLANLSTVRDLPFLLYRRVIEIRDGQLGLRAYGLTIQSEPAGPGRQSRSASAEATQIWLALEARAAGEIGTSSSAEAGPVAPIHLAGEIAWLERVSAEFRRSASRAVSKPRQRGLDSSSAG
jgi:hypothetical protein